MQAQINAIDIDTLAMDAATDPHEHALLLWKEHTSAKRLETEFFTQELLSKAYPNHTVIRTSPTKCDLLAFARAGHAEATLVSEESQDATRVYRAPASRVKGQTGKVEDAVSFGRWDYVWDDMDFIVYEMAYMDRCARVVRFLYILAPSGRFRDTPEVPHATVDRLLLISGQWTTEAHEQIWVFDNADWNKDKALWEAVRETSWEDVIVSPAVKTKLNQDVHGFFGNEDLYRKHRIPWKRGIIFHGVPGVGKTLFIKTLIKSLAERSPPVPTLYVKSLDACAGPKWSIQQIFSKARRAAPCLLVLEDLDSLVESHTRSYFLNEVDGLASNDGILMIGSTNNLEQLDTSLTKRPSRFDRKYHFAVPDVDERLAYCHYWRGRLDGEGVEFPDEMCLVMARLTEKFTFAYLKELFVCSLLLLVGSGAEEVGENDGTTETEQSRIAEGDEDGATEAEVSNAKPSLPEVEIPPCVQNNLLFQTIRSQAQALLEDIDSTPNSAAKQSGGAQPPRIQMTLPSLLDEPDQ